MVVAKRKTAAAVAKEKEQQAALAEKENAASQQSEQPEKGAESANSSENNAEKAQTGDAPAADEKVQENGNAPAAAKDSEKEAASEDDGNFFADDSKADEKKSDAANTTDKKSDEESKNDSACVVAYLSKLRVSIGPLTLAQVHRPEAGAILQERSACYSVHVPRHQNTEDDTTPLAMLDVECTSPEQAEALVKEFTEMFKDVESVKIQHWPIDKVFYNNYEYLDIEETIRSRFREGMLTAGFHKLRDRWCGIRNLEPTITNDQILEKIGKDAIDIFRSPSDNTRAYIRMGTREANNKFCGTSIEIEEKQYKIKSLTPHHSEKVGTNGYPMRTRGGRGRNTSFTPNGSFNRGANNGPNPYHHAPAHYAPPPHAYGPPPHHMPYYAPPHAPFHQQGPPAPMPHQQHQPYYGNYNNDNKRPFNTNYNGAYGQPRKQPRY